MASRLVAAAKAVSSSSPAPSLMARLVSRRGLADGYDYDRGKFNWWENPRRPMSWKRSHFIVATKGVWGVFAYGGCKLFDWVYDTENSAEISDEC
ncbi:unnamed protein product [Urochloa humidicola]